MRLLEVRVLMLCICFLPPTIVSAQDPPQQEQPQQLADGGVLLGTHGLLLGRLAGRSDGREGECTQFLLCTH